MSVEYAKNGDVQLAYYVEGSGPETVLLIMGLGGRAADWGEYVPRALGRSFRMVRFDNRGTGRSSRVTTTFTLEDLAHDATTVLDAIGASSAHVVGYSMGGMIAQLFALNHRERLNRLVLLATHFGGPSVEKPNERAARVFEPSEFVDRDPRAMAKFTIEQTTALGWAERHSADADALAACAAEYPTAARTFFAQINAIYQSDRSEAVSKVTHPTLVIHGEEDPLIPISNGKLLAARIPGARFESIPDCGHLVAWEQPEALVRLVSDFFSND